MKSRFPGLCCRVLVLLCALSFQFSWAQPVSENGKTAIIPQEPVGLKVGQILVAYPRGENGNKIESSASFIVGSVPPGRSLSCNGTAFAVNGDGYFSHVVPLKFGKNHFTLLLSGQEQACSLTVERSAPPVPLSTGSFTVLADSIEPREPMGLSPGDLLQFAARATPGCSLSVQCGGRVIPLRAASAPEGKKPAVNLGIGTAFGVSYQRSPALKDLYLGFYKIQPQDDWVKLSPVFVLQKGTRVLRLKSKGCLSVLKQPEIFETVRGDTVVRVAPGAARLTPLPAGVRFFSDGYRGEWRRIELCPGRHVWIAAADLAPSRESSALPESKISTVNLATDSYGARIALPLNQRLPFQIEQDPSGKKLTLRVFGASADTDFITSDLRPEFESACARLLDYVSFKQKGDLHYELSVHLRNRQQWGFFADYEDGVLVLHVKSAPAIDPLSDSLKGSVICIDPGHGGAEIGSVGCSGVKEASLNLAFASRLARELELMGARVIMTRKDDSEVSLQKRVDIAVASGADLLMSIHNNSLPDGRDPLLEHGTSSYWYHPQSMELGRIAQRELSRAIGFKDFGSRFQNLALCRPSRMPALLMEIGFMINPDELSRLLDPRIQDVAARSMAGSVKRFLLERVKEQANNDPAPAG